MNKKKKAKQLYDQLQNLKNSCSESIKNEITDPSDLIGAYNSIIGEIISKNLLTDNTKKIDNVANDSLNYGFNDDILNKLNDISHWSGDTMTKLASEFKLSEKPKAGYSIEFWSIVVTVYIASISGAYYFGEKYNSIDLGKKCSNKTDSLTILQQKIDSLENVIKTKKAIDKYTPPTAVIKAKTARQNLSSTR